MMKGECWTVVMSARGCQKDPMRWRLADRIGAGSVGCGGRRGWSPAVSPPQPPADGGRHDPDREHHREDEDREGDQPVGEPLERLDEAARRTPERLGGRP